jgi:hypothetical protein
MNIVDQATENQLKNIQTRTGKTLDELYAMIRQSGLTKPGEIRDMLKRELGMGHGDAVILASFYLKSGGNPAAKAPDVSVDEAVDEIYSGAKAGLRPIHDKLMTAIAEFGPFEAAPKKGYLSLRRKRQFAMLTPATKTRFEVGLNMKDVPASERLIELPAGGMCQYKVSLTDAKEVDPELIAWIRQAYEKAG